MHLIAFQTRPPCAADIILIPGWDSANQWDQHLELNFGAVARCRCNMALRRRGPQQGSISSHMAPIEGAPRKMETATQPQFSATAGMNNRNLRTSEIISIICHWSISGARRKANQLIFPSGTFTAAAHEESKPTDTCNLEFLDCFRFVFLTERLPAGQD